MKKLPLGIQTFRKIREGDYLYADKTEYIYNMIQGGNCYFLSRPRRFGKSLLVDTIREVFLGSAALFEGLWITSSGYDFKPRPVIHIDMSAVSNRTPEILSEEIVLTLRKFAADEGVEIQGKSPGMALSRLIEALRKKHGERVAVLIDEYDKPIIDRITAPETAAENREVMREFYGILKSQDTNLCFVFLTGVSKFAHASVFSQLNNLYDMTLTKEYAGICGFTADEFDSLFAEHMAALPADMTPPRGGEPELRESIFRWYDGYTWDGVTHVFNPFSLLGFFKNKSFYPFWFLSGEPKFLMEIICRDPTRYVMPKDMTFTVSSLTAGDVENIELVPLLFQTGYLTVEHVRAGSEALPMYTLRSPNLEVESAFNERVAAALTAADAAAAFTARANIMDGFRRGDAERIAVVLRGLIASIPYELHIEREAYYHSVFYALMRQYGAAFLSEVSVADGRIDGVLELNGADGAGKLVYIMEMKYTKCPKDADGEEKDRLLDAALDSALRQIDERGYADSYAGGGVGVRKLAIAVTARRDVKARILQ
jgi:hypothetical protein